jgi:hypothetical protein
MVGRTVDHMTNHTATTITDPAPAVASFVLAGALGPVADARQNRMGPL